PHPISHSFPTRRSSDLLFAKWSLQLREVNSIDEIKTVLNETMRPYIYEKIGEFKSAFLNIRHSSYNPLYRLRYVLGKIENTVLSKSGLPLKGHKFFNGNPDFDKTNPCPALASSLFPALPHQPPR